ncbi:MAG: limonene-1,2-epoxide hydrolase family protein [Gammaproteobacteria bacterium]|nr:MAG: limonene-1,2-epoxide hydrolase family protein [Gammaproteobacteria bacterium]
MSRTGPTAGAAPGANPTLERVERDNEALARSFCAAWSAMDPERIVAHLAPDCVYQIYRNGPVKRGAPEIHATLAAFMQRWQRVEFEIFRLSALGDFVLHERSERYTGRDGHPDWEFNVTSLLLIENGRIRRWRDDALPGARQVVVMPENG